MFVSSTCLQNISLRKVWKQFSLIVFGAFQQAWKVPAHRVFLSISKAMLKVAHLRHQTILAITRVAPSATTCLWAQRARKFLFSSNTLTSTALCPGELQQNTWRQGSFCQKFTGALQRFSCTISKAVNYIIGQNVFRKTSIFLNFDSALFD